MASSVEQALDLFTKAIKSSTVRCSTGPTGSGKSTTLYAALHELNDGDRGILTIEDPVEQRIAGIVNRPPTILAPTASTPPTYMRVRLVYARHRA